MTHERVTVTEVRDRKIWTTLKANQITGFPTVPPEKKYYFFSSFFASLFYRLEKNLNVVHELMVTSEDGVYIIFHQTRITINIKT